MKYVLIAAALTLAANANAGMRWGCGKGHVHIAPVLSGPVERGYKWSVWPHKRLVTEPGQKVH